MSVAEMKIRAMDYLLHLESEKAITAALTQLENLTIEEKAATEKKLENIFEEAASQYGDTLKKLAE